MCRLLFNATLPIYRKANEEAQGVYYTGIKKFRHLRTLKKCTKHSPMARVFYISFVFSNAHHVLLQHNAQVRLLYFVKYSNNRVSSYNIIICANFDR